MSDPKTESVQRIYAAVGRNDVDAILDELDDGVDWAPEASSRSVPWYGSYQGKAEVPRFFATLGSAADITEFAPVSFTANDTDVMVAVRFAYTVRATGKQASMTMLHWWRFKDGKVVFFRGAEDTEQSAAAFAG